MPRVCCRLHMLLDSPDFPLLLKNNNIENFCIFLQETIHKRTKSSILFDNPNDVEIYFYLFAGLGTQYLSTMAGEFVTFAPEKSMLSTLKWFPVVTTKQTHQTKSLSFVSKTNLPTGLLLLISYYKNYLKRHEQFQMHFHMTIQLQVQTLLFILLTTQDFQLQLSIGQRLTTITLCNDYIDINAFITNDEHSSLSNADKIILRNQP